MSFIYAEKYLDNESNREHVRILCDTKILLDEYTLTNLSKAGSDLISKYGIVKSTICCPDLCVSFAGNNILYAAKLFMTLKDLGSFELEDVSDYALRIHRSANALNDIEFVVTYYSSDQIHIDVVKDGKLYKDQMLAHIGSEIAFNAFQETRLQAGHDASKHTDYAFRDVVNGCKDDSVGGRTIEVMYDYQCNSFLYHWERAFHTSKPQIVALGSNIVFHTSASDGGYSYEVVHKDIENVCFIVDQMEPAILYSRRFRVDSSDVGNPHLFGLMLPMLVKTAENGDLIRCQ